MKVRTYCFFDDMLISIQFNSDDDLSLKKTLEVHNMEVVFRAVFHEGNKHYTQVFLDECLCKL